MEDKNNIVPFTEIQDSRIDLNLVVKQANEMTKILDAMGIEKATFKTGDIFHRNEASNTATLATNGFIVERGEHTTSVTFRNENSTEKEAMEELSKPKYKTQEILGSFSGKSQPWTSNILSDNNDKEEDN